MTKDNALKLALVTLERTGNIAGFAHEREQAAITVIREALAHPWVGLTDEEMYEAVRPLCNHDQIARALVGVSEDEYRAIEAKLKEKNT